MKYANKIQCIHLFPHSGTNLPPDFRKYLQISEKSKKLQKVVEDNRDIGFDELIDEIVKTPGRKKNSAIFKYARYFLDPNRLDVSDQMPEKPYRGKNFFKLSHNQKVKLAQKYIIPWQKKVMELARTHLHCIVVHWHSFDVYAGGYSTVKLGGNGHKYLRPLAQVFTRVDAKKNSLKCLFPCLEDKVYVARLIPKKMVDPIRALLKKRLTPYTKYPNVRVEKDFPFITHGYQKGQRLYSPSLPNLIHLARGNKRIPQLVVEIRKDVLRSRSGRKAVIDAVDECIHLLTHKS